MTGYKDIKTFSRSHETIADLLTLLAVVLLFMSIVVALEYYQPAMHWLSGNYALRLPLLLVGLGLNALSILALLAVGSARFGEEEESERCFSTFRGRRAQHGARGIFVS